MVGIAHQRALKNDTAYPQQQKGTETAHGTNHKPRNARYAVTFESRSGPIRWVDSYIYLANEF